MFYVCFYHYRAVGLLKCDSLVGISLVLKYVHWQFAADKIYPGPKSEWGEQLLGCYQAGSVGMNLTEREGLFTSDAHPARLDEARKSRV